MKRLIILLLSAIFILSSCSSKNESNVDSPKTSSDDKTIDNKDVKNESTSKVDISNIKIEEADLNKIASEKKLTMVNIWGTFCGPCLEEMPTLGEISNEYKDKDFQIVGIVTDVLDSNGEFLDSQITVAKEVISKTNANYLNILPSKDLIDNMLKDISVVPTTIFLDSKGNKVGETILGAKDKTQWIEEIDKRLKEV